jgi:hypothetical protein
VLWLEIKIPLGLEHSDDVFTEMIVVMDARKQRYMWVPLMMPAEQCAIKMGFDGVRGAIDLKMGVALRYWPPSMLSDLNLGATSGRTRSQTRRSIWWLFCTTWWWGPGHVGGPRCRTTGTGWVRGDRESFTRGVCKGEIYIHSMRPHDQTLNFLSHAVQVFPRKASPRNVACQETGRGGKRRKSALSFWSRSSDSFRWKFLRGSGYFKEGEVLAEAGI